MENNIIKIGSVELTESEAERLYNEGKYVVTYGTIYRVNRSKNAGYYGQKIYSKPTHGGVGFAKRGYFFTTDAQGVNRLAGKQLVIN